MKQKTTFKNTAIGEIPEGWNALQLGKMAELVKEVYRPNKQDNLPHVGLEHIDQQSLTLNLIGNSSDIGSNKFYFKAGDVLFGKLRPYFRKVYRPKFDGVCSTDIWVIRAKDEIDQGFLFYFLANRDFVDLASRGSSGTRMPRADWDYLKNTEWFLPSFDSQRAIAKILSDLDEKIELNRQMNKTLEAIAQAIFKQWFVDFESTGSFDWQADELGKHIEFIKGKKPSQVSETQFVGYRPQILIDNLNGNPSLYANENGMIVVRIDEPIMVMDGASSGRVEIGHNGVLGSTLAKVIVTSDRISNLFLYYFLKTKESGINQNTTGTSIPHADKERIKKYQCNLPPKKLLETFNNIAAGFLNKIITNKKEIKILVQIRDSLLPRLMSGKIRV